jgi:hypothetical protein
MNWYHSIGPTPVGVWIPQANKRVKYDIKKNYGSIVNMHDIIRDISPLFYTSFKYQFVSVVVIFLHISYVLV